MCKAPNAEADFATPAIISGSRIRVGRDTMRVVIPSASGSAEPRVDVIRDGDIVQAIDVICACGKRFRLVCEYESSNKQL